MRHGDRIGPDKATLAELRELLFELHRLVLEETRASYEQEAGKVTPQHFLRLLMNDPQFGWLRPFSSLLAEIDEALEADPEDRELIVTALNRVNALFAFTEQETAFSLPYKPLLQRSPEIAAAHGEVRRLLPRNPIRWS